MKKRLLAMVLSLGLVLGSITPACAATFYYDRTPIEYRMDALEALILEIQENYKDKVDLDTLFYGIYQGLYGSLGDPWSAFYPPDNSSEGADLVTTTSEQYQGIGITFKKSANGILITATVAGSPARTAGLKTGDYILKVGSVDVTEMDVEDISSLIRGTEGSSVTLTIDRDGEEKVFTIVRAVIKSNTVTHQMMDGNIGYIDIDSFEAGTPQEFSQARESLLAQGAASLVIDLRDNGGGLLSAAIDIADQMIPTGGMIITEFKRQGEVIGISKSTADSTKQVPCVVLVNGRSASASECLAAALKERGIAKLVGERTYGKGCAQIMGDAGKGAVYKMSLYYFLSPLGNDIDGVGIAPDLAVSNAGNVSTEEAAAIRAGFAPMTEERKYSSGETGLNVYAAQQRLAVLGYDVKATAIMDASTVSALKQVQKDSGGYPYGGLDFFTMKAIDAAVDRYLSGDTYDYQLEAALKALK